MNASLSMQRLRRPRIAPGILVSLALHAALIFGYRLAVPARPPAAAPHQTMTVWLHPYPPLPKPMPMVAPAKQAAPRELRTDVARTGLPTSARMPERMPERTPAQAAAPATASPSATPPGEPYDPLRAEPVQPFDMEAARSAARKVASDRDTLRPDSLAKRMEEHPLYPEDRETQLQKGIAGAKRADCRTSAAGAGILAPLVWLLDKKDSGCKF
ncbi:MAG: hypothetical protein ABW069_10425 [Duganella sp.]